MRRRGNNPPAMQKYGSPPLSPEAVLRRLQAAERLARLFIPRSRPVLRLVRWDDDDDDDQEEAQAQ